MKFTYPILPTREALHNPVANLIRNSSRPEVDRILSMSRGTRDNQYKLMLRERGLFLWRKTIYLSNKYAQEHPELTKLP